MRLPASLFSNVCLPPPPPLHNRLQLPGVPQRVFNHHLANLLLLLLLPFLVGVELGGGGEVNSPILDDPTAVVGKVDDGAFRVEEEEGLG